MLHILMIDDHGTGVPTEYKPQIRACAALQCSFRAHHRGHGLETGRNSRGRQIKNVHNQLNMEFKKATLNSFLGLQSKKNLVKEIISLKQV